MKSSYLSIPMTLVLAAAAPAERVRLEISQETTFGNSVFVRGDLPVLGSGDVTRALKLSPSTYPVWWAELELPAGTEFTYQFITREDAPSRIADATNWAPLPGTAGQERTMTVPGVPDPPRSGFVRYLSGDPQPVLQVFAPGATTTTLSVPMRRLDEGRAPGEWLWGAPTGPLPAAGDWEFTIALTGGREDRAPGGGRYITLLARPWLQDGQLYNYQPPPQVSPPRVLKFNNVPGTRPARTFWIYLPRGYDQNTEKHYPLVYMHDGQNCFQAYVQDATFGTSWRADETATLLISQGRVRECIIVGVQSAPNDFQGLVRIEEYLPPYTTAFGTLRGAADEMAAYYRGSVADYMTSNYRILPGRDHRATVGSSMGGFFSTYLAWEHSDFFRHHACVSNAYWIADNNDEVYNRLRTGAPRDVRIYLDSGTQNSMGSLDGSDGMWDTFRARESLMENGYALGPDFQHQVAPGASHNEASWSARFDDILLFLMPIRQEPEADAPVPDFWTAY